jgi:hypothetical protein
VSRSPMLKEYADDAVLREHLELAQRYVTEGQWHVQRQRAVIRGLERYGYDSRDARWLLGTIEDLLRMHVRERDRLRELAWMHAETLSGA